MKPEGGQEAAEKMLDTLWSLQYMTPGENRVISLPACCAADAEQAVKSSSMPLSLARVSMSKLL